MTGGTQLHAHFHFRNQHAFHKLLEASHSGHGQPSSGGRSLNKPSPLSSGNRPEVVDVNARDSLGRTALHLAASSPDASAPEYVRMLLAHPSINPNLQDYESHWTALHRALYGGNIASALLLLQRGDVDTNLKDLEGYRAFDLYNSTVHGTKPEASSRTDLFTWGANRNAALGLGDGDDRVYPDQVVVERVPKPSEQDPLEMRFGPVRVNHVVMSKLHTAVVTNEARANVRACGFGSGGRLGHANHTQYMLLPLPLSLPSTSNLSNAPSNAVIAIISLALGQDHTLALTSTGDVYSWGLNRFSQLGYTIDPVSTVAGVPRHQQEEVLLIQNTPRKVTAPSLKGKIVMGIAACRTASVCWSKDEVWTWGTNGGQLGYDKSAHPTQILPRKVTKVVTPVLQISITETVMACLLETHDVVCIYNDASFKINFPTQTFPSSMPTYRPPQAVRNASIKKVTASPGGEGFATLSENGELFLCTFVERSSRDVGQQQGQGGGRDGGQVKVQRVWALRKQFSAVKDVEVGVDGSIIICTESGHVFIRSRNPNLSTPSSSTGGSLLSSTNPNSASNAKAFKFQRVPYIQRVIRVCANSLGAFGALRVDADPNAWDRGRGLEIAGETIPESLRGVRSWLVFDEDPRTRLVVGSQESHGLSSVAAEKAPGQRDDDEEEDEAIVKDIAELKALCEVLERHQLSQRDPATLTSTLIKLFNPHVTGKWFVPTSLPPPSMTAFGADLIVGVKAFKFPAHRLLLAARSEVLRAVLEGQRSIDDSGKEGRIQLKLVPTTPSSSKANTRVYPQAPWHTHSHLSISGVHPLTVLILLTYIYTDELLAFWDPRIIPHISRRLKLIGMDVKPMQLRGELQRLARLLGMNEVLHNALAGNVKRVLEPRLAEDLIGLSTDLRNSHSACIGVATALSPDVLLILADIQVPCHSTILRSRSHFFSSFFDDEDWTRERWTELGVLKVDLRHLEWKAVRFVVWYLYGGDKDMFERLDFVRTVDELIEFMFEAMAAANELLLDRLVLICSSVILKRVTIANACSVLAEATHFHALPLIRQIQRYISINLETFLESRMLDDLPVDLIKQLSAFIRTEQEVKSPISKSGQLTRQAMETYKDWLALQDIPGPILRSSRFDGMPRTSAKLSPPGPGRKKDRTGSAAAVSTPPSPAVRPQFEVKAPQAWAPGGTTEGEVFVMDDNMPTLTLDQTAQLPQTPPATSAKISGGWKVGNTPKSDMKAIMAEAETIKRPNTRLAPDAPPAPLSNFSKPTDSVNWRSPQRTPRTAPEAPSVLLRTPSGGTPWRLPSASNIASTSVNACGSTPPATPSVRPMQSREDIAQNVKPVHAEMLREPPTPPRMPGMGPVFTPKKANSPSKSSSSSSFRRVSSSTSGSAWTLPPVQPIVQPSILEGTPKSFAAIQQLQLEQDMAPTKDKRSLKQIQEEEQAKQVEDDFLKWWAAEEERMKLEQVAVQTSQEQRPRRDKGKGKGKAQPGNKPGDKPEHQGGNGDSGSQPSNRGSGGQRRKGRHGPPRAAQSVVTHSMKQECA